MTTMVVSREEELRREIRERVFELYNSAKREVIPLLGHVLVYVLPKEHMSTGGIIMPEGQQNKPVYEGIVVRTFSPVTRKSLVFDKDKNCKVEKEYPIISDFKLGDHVLFRHYEGMPVGDILNEKQFRIIREEAIEGRMEYDSMATFRENLEKILEEGRKVSDIISDLLAKFHLVRRDTKSLTTSGA